MKRPRSGIYKILGTVYAVAIVWTSVAYAVENRNTVISVAHAAAPIRVITAARGSVRAYVQRVARAEGVDPRVAEWIVAHESSHQPRALGDGGESRGLWQINKAWHPEVSDACAYNVSCSTHWSLQRIKTGYADEWSTYKYCKQQFEDCPFQGKVAQK